MPLDPQVEIVLQLLAAAGGPPLETLSPPQARAAFAQMILPSDEPVARVEDHTIPGPAGAIPARVYAPEGSGLQPVLVFYHGGGWVIGDIETYDLLCRTLANRAGCAVVSVDYRLAPEHPFPAAVDDAYAAAQWVHEHGREIGVDPARIAVGGDSAGGNLAAVVAYLAHERGTPPLVYQALIYPSTDLGGETESHRLFAEGYFLTRSTMNWFRDQYVPQPADRQNPLAAPLLAEDLRGLPPALVITGEYDPLRDEGEAYAERLRAAGVPVVRTRYEGMIHGFVSMAPIVDKGKAAIDQIAAALRSAFTPTV